MQITRIRAARTIYKNVCACSSVSYQGRLSVARIFNKNANYKINNVINNNK